ncbi:hypothetical protein BaRGS_00026803, partial [Batillaria attramentaria]
RDKSSVTVLATPGCNMAAAAAREGSTCLMQLLVLLLPVLLTADPATNAFTLLAGNNGSNLDPTSTPPHKSVNVPSCLIQSLRGFVITWQMTQHFVADALHVKASGSTNVIALGMEVLGIWGGS